MPPPTPRVHRHWLLAGLTVVLVVALLVGVGIGYAVRGPGSSGSRNTTTSSSPQHASVASRIDPELADVWSTLGYEGAEAAGTGMVLTSSGVVLTNNHVIDGATSVKVTDIGNGKTYSATVVGYDASGDIAVLQLQGAAGLATVPTGNSSAVRVGNPVVAIGNAGGTGGTPSVAKGNVTALDQSITAASEVSGASEHLTGLIETNAPLQPGDSGGPLVNASGDVIGMDTAASSGFSFSAGTTEGFAIPMNAARLIAKQIESRKASDTVHIGPTAFLGVLVGTFPGVTGAVVMGVNAGTPAQRAGLVAGDVIVSLNGESVLDPTQLTTLLQARHPGDTVRLGWQDASGQSRAASVTLGTGPAG